MTIDDHWLARTSTIKRLWTAFIAALGALVLMDFLIEHHPHFGLDGTFGFSAWFGFLSCVGLIAFATVLGKILKRSDRYYDG